MTSLCMRRLLQQSCSLIKVYRTLAGANTRRGALPLSSSSVMAQPGTRRHGHGRAIEFPQLPPEWRDRFQKGQMYKFNDKLMKLPVPQLAQTLQKYITSIEPLLNEDELAETKRQVEEFGTPGGVGQTLQEKLLERASSTENWLAEWWLQVAYLGWRLPVTVNVSPAIVYPQQPINSTESFLRVATQFVLAYVKWILLIEHEAVPPDVYRGKPMCMSQYDLFRKCRIPRPEMDESIQTPLSESRHIIVIRNGHLFRLDILYKTSDGVLSVAPASYIVEQLETVLSDARDPAHFPVGIMTTEHRDTWSEMRERLASDSFNTDALRDIETAMFVLCLDRGHSQVPSHPSLVRDSHSEILTKRALHGNGTQQNSCNRWFDSAVQVVIGEDGGCGSLLEHSAGDGPASIASNIFVMDLLKRMKYDVFSEKSAVESGVLRPVKMLQWRISPVTVADIQTASDNCNKMVEDVDLACLTFSDFGKDFCKSVKLSPDAFVQVAIQLAFYKEYGHPTAMYESGGTRWFKYGRTDTIRSTTNASHAFIKAMSNLSIQAEEKANLLMKAIAAHSKYTEDAISGQAIDRHLLGLRMIAAENGIETPGLYQDVAYSRSLHFRLSSSQVPVANYPIFLCFGAVVEDGYGVCYNPRDHEIVITVTSWNSCQETDSLKMSQNLDRSLREMRDLLVSTGRSKTNAKL